MTTTISIHAPRTGSDASFWRFLRIFSDNFNPRSPHGERRFRGGAHLSAWGISIHAPRTGSDLHLSSALSAFPISIHAPRTGSDSFSCPSARAYSNFNPRSPHGERRSPSRPCWDRESYFNPRSPHGERHCYRKQLRAEWAFQSTLPARGATRTRPQSCRPRPFQSTLPARGATRADYLDSLPLPFQSTLPARGATRGTAARGGGFRRISIHAPALICAKNFNPRSPHGERRYSVAPASKRTHFNPRSPHGERRAGRSDRRPDRPISIHAPRTGSDAFSSDLAAIFRVFQSTLPARGATLRGTNVCGMT